MQTWLHLHLSLLLPFYPTYLHPAIAFSSHSSKFLSLTSFHNLVATNTFLLTTWALKRFSRTFPNHTALKPSSPLFLTWLPKHSLVPLLIIADITFCNTSPNHAATRTSFTTYFPNPVVAKTSLFTSLPNNVTPQFCHLSPKTCDCSLLKSTPLLCSSNHILHLPPTAHCQIYVTASETL